jgi:ATP-dependent Clp protease ATP-binding subunit ClpA
MHRAWKAEHCGETSVDTQRLISLISNFVPFFPLDFDSVRELCERNLRERRAALLANDGTQLSWDRAVPDRMADQVEYTNGFAAEGASSARRADRFVSRAVRSVQADVMARAERQPDALRLQVERGNIVARVGDVA